MWVLVGFIKVHPQTLSWEFGGLIDSLGQGMKGRVGQKQVGMK